MAAILFSAAVTCIASLFVGQAALRLAGAREWSWLAPPVGLSVLMLISAPANHVPGRAVTWAVVIGIVTIAAIAWCLAAPEHRPPLGGLLAAAPVLLLALIPFLAVDSAGILGVSFDNDMAAHMLFVEAYISSRVEEFNLALFDIYPLGPHAMTALLSKGLGMRVDYAFTGWSMALPILNAWTAVALVRHSTWVKQAPVATVVAMPFLVTAYYAEGSFKEVAQAGLVFAVVVFFAGCGPQLGRGRWVPLALLLGGIVSVYSVTGLPWPIAIGGLWILVTVVQLLRRGGASALRRWMREELPAIGIGLGVLLVFLIPQIPRIGRYISENSGTDGIIVPKDVLGNHVAPLPFWEGLGVWTNPDFRLPASPAFIGGMLAAFVLALVLFGVVWMIRRGRWILPLSAGASLLIWHVSKDSQSPYVVAKALVILSPLLLALAVLPLVEQAPDRLPRSFSSLLRAAPGQPLAGGLAAMLAVALLLMVGISDVRALRTTPVGSTGKIDQLREIRPLLDDEPTLFIGDDDFVRWALAGVPLGTPLFGGEETMIRAEKEWTRGEALDFDAFDAATLNSYDWVITTRDVAASSAPPQLKLAETTPSYALWRRDGTVRERSILPEGGMAGAVLRCDTPEGRAVLRGGGVAAVRPKPVEAEGPLLAPGGTAVIELPLGRGSWQLESTYLSRLPIEVRAPSFRTTLQPNLDRVGPRLPIGQIEVDGEQRTTVVAFTVDDPLLAPNIPVADLGTVLAARIAPTRVVPVEEACGRYVDWYRPARPGR